MVTATLGAIDPIVIQLVGGGVLVTAFVIGQRLFGRPQRSAAVAAPLPAFARVRITDLPEFADAKLSRALGDVSVEHQPSAAAALGALQALGVERGANGIVSVTVTRDASGRWSAVGAAVALEETRGRGSRDAASSTAAESEQPGATTRAPDSSAPNGPAPDAPGREQAAPNAASPNAAAKDPGNIAGRPSRKGNAA